MPTPYFAAPLFSSAERTFNLALTERRGRAGLTVFLSQRDGAESDREPYSAMSKADRRQAMFNPTLDPAFDFIASSEAGDFIDRWRKNGRNR